MKESRKSKVQIFLFCAELLVEAGLTLAITTPSTKVLTSLNLCRNCIVSVTI